MDKNKEKGREEYGEIVSMLLQDGLITPQQVEYVLRIQSKLPNPRPMIHILKELGYVTDDALWQSIRKNHVSLRIGSLLVELGIITNDDLQKAFEIQAEEKPKKKIGEILVAHRIVDEKKMVEVLSLQLGFPFVEPEFLDIDIKLFNRIPSKMYESCAFIPIQIQDDAVQVAFIDPTDTDDIKKVKEILKQEVLPCFALKNSIKEATHKLFSRLIDQQTQVSSDSAVGIVNQMVVDAINDNISDIHIEPMPDRLRIRFRRDGVLDLYKELPLEIIPTLTSRIKVMCGADITEKRRHQDARLMFDHAGYKLDLRVSFFATVFGEKVVLRLLNLKRELVKLKDIGMYPRMLQAFNNDALELPSGVILVTGPTGSGKTTTVYSCIDNLNTPQTSIITAEEPVEYVIPGIAQCGIDPKINLTFESTLRAMVRQDPDVIVIGEIRDTYSAEIAVQAALTGHKVITTFHTEDSIGGLVRLMNMNIEAFMISSTVVSVLAQRLLRRVCPKCAEDYKLTIQDLRRLRYTVKDIHGGKFRKGRGCSYCRHTGYKGRIACFELLVLDESVRNAILEKKTSHDIRRTSIESAGLVTLIEDGIVKASYGITTIDEVLHHTPRLLNPRPLIEIKRLLGAT
ncbi:MAG: Flp pilus assembly complex ATPase component TadA [Desulfamplus sp.]|nr:Flp pilus assembly complex ATPase component TadA [Desulfamplus sp.]